MSASFWKFLLVTLVGALGLGALVYAVGGRTASAAGGTSARQEAQFLADVRQVDSLHVALKKTDPVQQASEFSNLRFRQESLIERMDDGYGGDSLFRAITRTTARNDRKRLDAVAAQVSDRQTAANLKDQLTNQVAGLKTDIQGLETQLMLKQTSLENLRALQAAQP